MPEFKPSQLGKTVAPLRGSAPKVAPEDTMKEREVLEAEKIYRKGVVSIRDIIAPASMKVESDHLRVGSKFVRTIFVTTYPRYISVGWFAPIINFSIPLDIAMFFYPVNSAIILKQLKKKVGTLEAQIMADVEKGAPRDPLRETALRDIEALRDSLTQGTEKFFQFALYVTFYADAKEELDELTKQIELVFGAKLVMTRRVLFQAEQGFNSTMPLGNDELMITYNMNSSPTASSFPFISSDLTSDSGVMYGINRHNNSLVIFDRFSLQNANFTVFATSGAGKSVDRTTEVMVQDRDGIIRKVQIGTLIDALGIERGFSSIDDELEGVVDPGISVYTFNDQLRGEWSRVGIAARKRAPTLLYCFTTQSGRSIRVTGDHNMLVLRDGKVTAAKSEEVHIGEPIPLPRLLPEPNVPTTSFDTLSLLREAPRVYLDGCQEFIAAHLPSLRRARIDPQYDAYLLQYARARRIPIVYFWKILAALGITGIDEALSRGVRLCSARKRRTATSLPSCVAITPALARLLGYIISEGTVTADEILITNYDPEVLADIAQCLTELGWASFSRQDGTVVLASRVLVAYCKALGVHGKAGEKRAPPFLFNCSATIISHFLRAYFEGDGGVERHSVSACSKSKALISDLSYFLLRFGIIARLSTKEKRATNSETVGQYWYCTISGQEHLRKFQEGVSFVSRRKQECLRAIVHGDGNTNVDTIPVQHIMRELWEFFSPPLRGLQDVVEVKNGSYTPSPVKLHDIIVQVEERLEHFRAMKQRLACAAGLPTITEVVTYGSATVERDRTLSHMLGDRWHLMRNGDVSPRTQTVLAAVSTLFGMTFSLQELKAIIHEGFRDLDLSITGYGRGLASALLATNRDENTQYALLHGAARHVWNAYTKLEQQLPRVLWCIAALKRFADADLFWDPIVAIEKEEGRDAYVYDLTVDNEVFLAGHGGLFVHNSYTIKLEVLRSLMMGVDVIIIDPEMEYKHLSDAVGGTYVNVSLASEAKVNPFDLPRAVGEEVKTADIIRSAVITLKGLLKLMLGKLTPQEDSLVDRALLETYAKKDITADSDLSKVEPPLMQDLQDILEGMEGADDIALRLKKYTQGTFAGLFTSPTNVDMRNQLVTFSVRDLEDELRPIAIYTIVNYIWNVVRSSLKKRILVIDEAWWLMQNEDSAKFIFALVKRCRKYYLGVTTITQDVNDFLRSPYGQAILNNSALQFLLKQSPAAIEIVQKTFMLTEGEKYLLLESGVGEGIFFAGQKHAAIAVKASYAEDQLITSDPRQLLEIEEAKRKFAEETTQ